MKFILISILWMSGLACTLSAQTTNPRYYCYDAAGVSAGFITGAGNAWMNGASFKQGLIQGGIGAAFGLGTGAVGGAAGGWFSTTPAGQKVGSWIGKHSKGRFFDRKNPNSPFSPNGKNTNVYVEDYTVEFPAYDDGVHQVPAQTYTVDVPEPDLGGANLWPAASGDITVINGIEYTIHALERMQHVGTIMNGATSYSRGIPPSAVENAIKFGTITPGHTAAEVVRTFDNLRVITNPTGTRVITVFKIW